ncbi:MAG: hypothetical protein ACJAUH_001093 [Saprospiraceae bacterium]|jgi:hypothetical protein
MLKMYQGLVANYKSPKSPKSLKLIDDMKGIDFKGEEPLIQAMS